MVSEARYHDRVKFLQAFDANWQDRLDAPTPFDKASWYQLIAETGITPLIAVADDGSASVAVALTEDGGWITPLRNWYSFIWRQLGCNSAAAKALLVDIARHLKSRSYRVTLEPVPDEDGSAQQLIEAFTAAGWRVEAARCDINHALEVKGRSFAEYWAQRPGSLRATLKRKGKKVQTHIATQFDPLLWEEYERIYAASWKPAEGNPAMLRAFAKSEGHAGRLRLGLAYDGDLAIAAQFWTVEQGTAYIHKLAHLESHKHLSVGTTLSAILFQHVIDCDRVALIDFGTGDQPYKADWMEVVRPRYRIDCLNPDNPRAWAPLAKRMLRRIAEPGKARLAPRPAHG